MSFNLQLRASQGICSSSSSPMAVAGTSPIFARISVPGYRRCPNSDATITTPKIAECTFRGICSSTNYGTAIPFRLGSTRGNMSSFRCFAALTPELKTTLDKVVTSQKIVLFMKGTKDFPQCGFSNTVVQILKSFNVPFETINILENEVLRVGLKEYSSWPTFPQLYIDGEFFGGCDITIDAHKSGELQELLEKAICS